MIKFNKNNTSLTDNKIKLKDDVINEERGIIFLNENPVAMGMLKTKFPWVNFEVKEDEIETETRIIVEIITDIRKLHDTPIKVFDELLRYLSSFFEDKEYAAMYSIGYHIKSNISLFGDEIVITIKGLF